MKLFPYYDEGVVSRQLELQKKFAWDLEKSISWSTVIDENRLLVPLDESAFVFKSLASKEGRVRVSQLMGLVMASSIFEMEECLIRLRNITWEHVKKDFPVSPEYSQLGDQFFLEEDKHSKSFRRYVTKFCETLNLDEEELYHYLPRVEGTTTEWLLKKELEFGGASFWWVVAHVEQVFLHLYQQISQHKDNVEPLYYELHRKHFEEEARHASFPYTVIDLLLKRQSQNFGQALTRTSLVSAQIMQVVWTSANLDRLKKLKKKDVSHPFLKDIKSILKNHLDNSQLMTSWKLMTSVPFVTALTNPNVHPKFMKLVKEMGIISIPFPDPDLNELVNY